MKSVNLTFFFVLNNYKLVDLLDYIRYLCHITKRANVQTAIFSTLVLLKIKAKLLYTLISDVIFTTLVNSIM